MQGGALLSTFSGTSDHAQRQLGLQRVDGLRQGWIPAPHLCAWGTARAGLGSPSRDDAAGHTTAGITPGHGAFPTRRIK